MVFEASIHETAPNLPCHNGTTLPYFSIVTHVWLYHPWLLCPKAAPFRFLCFSQEVIVLLFAPWSPPLPVPEQYRLRYHLSLHRSRLDHYLI